jgi:hypothetical protein
MLVVLIWVEVLFCRQETHLTKEMVSEGTDLKTINQVPL